MSASDHLNHLQFYSPAQRSHMLLSGQRDTPKRGEDALRQPWDESTLTPDVSRLVQGLKNQPDPTMRHLLR